MRRRDQDTFRNDVMESTIAVGFERGWRISRLRWDVALGTPVWDKSTLFRQLGG